MRSVLIAAAVVLLLCLAVLTIAVGVMGSSLRYGHGWDRRYERSVLIALAVTFVLLFGVMALLS